MRAYLRIDPHLADHKAKYPDGAFRAFIECLIFAEHQPNRGRFRNERLLRVLLEKRGRWAPYLIEHRDLIVLPTGELYVDGWDEWQEGDVTVPERMQRLRNRKKKAVTPPTVTDDTAAGVSVPLAVGGKRLAVGEAEAVGGAPLPNGGATTFMAYRPKPGAHEGQHPNCFVCHPKLADAPKASA